MRTKRPAPDRRSFVETFPNPVSTVEEQTAAIASMLDVEAKILAKLQQRHDLQIYAHLADANAHNATSRFRVTGPDVYDCSSSVAKQDWKTVSKFPTNYLFFTGLPARFVPDRRLMRQLVGVRQELVTGNLRLIVRQARAFKIGSRTHHSIDELINVAVLGWLVGVNKYAPGKEAISARTFKSTCLGRLSAELLTFRNTTSTQVHLYPRDRDRLVELRAGRVEPENDDDHLLVAMDSHHVSRDATVTPDGETTTGVDDFADWMADGNPNPEEALIAHEEAMAELARSKPGKLGGK